MQDHAAAEGVVRHDRLWLYLLFALLATAGFFYINIMSAIVDGLITALGFANAEAGLVGSANIYGASVGSLCAVFIVRHVRWRPALLALSATSACTVAQRRSTTTRRVTWTKLSHTAPCDCGDSAANQ